LNAGCPQFDLGHGQRFRVETSIFLRVVVLHGIIEGSLHCFLQLDVRLCLGENLAHSSDIVHEEVLVHG